MVEYQSLSMTPREISFSNNLKRLGKISGLAMLVAGTVATVSSCPGEVLMAGGAAAIILSYLHPTYSFPMVNAK